MLRRVLNVWLPWRPECQYVVGHQLVVTLGEKRGLTVMSASLLSNVPGWPVFTACDHSQGVAVPNRLTQAAGSFIPGRPLCTVMDCLDTHSVFDRPAGREGERRAVR